MERKIVFCQAQSEYDKVAKLFLEGWVLDRMIYDGKPMRLECATVYHLIKYDEKEIEELRKEFMEEVEQIRSIQSVPLNEADALIKKGYEVLQTYQKTVTLVKKEKVTEQPKAKEEKKNV